MTAEHRFYCIILFTFVTALFGFFNLKKLPSIKSKLILIAITLGLFADLIGHNFTQITGMLNYVVYNVFTALSFLIYYAIIFMLLRNNIHIKLAKIIISAFIGVLTIIILFFFDTFINGISSVIYTSAVLGLLLLSILYLVELYNSDKILHFGKSVFFWFVVGVLVFHIPFLPFMLSVKFFLIDFDPLIYTMILLLLNIFMDSCLIYGFICSKKTYNY